MCSTAGFQSCPYIVPFACWTCTISLQSIPLPLFSPPIFTLTFLYSRLPCTLSFFVEVFIPDLMYIYVRTYIHTYIHVVSHQQPSSGFQGFVPRLWRDSQLVWPRGELRNEDLIRVIRLEVSQRVKGVKILCMANHVGSDLCLNVSEICSVPVIPWCLGDSRFPEPSTETLHWRGWSSPGIGLSLKSYSYMQFRVWSSPSAPYLTLTVTSGSSVAMSSLWELQYHQRNVPFTRVYLYMIIIA